MQIQVNTDKNVQGGESLAARVQTKIESALANFADRITRVEAHLSDQNAVKGGADMRCVLEARLAGLQPIAVTHQAESLGVAIDVAVEKLEKAISSALGRLNDRS
ncbi:MAG TPA: HPF/RaiA family ribosome-associated protein [Steroidobacter sp.]|jgi:ribosome-associated translation inhibitor RaiA|nr:HPF/RaiA family ribosome-associated protein [Steroidobacteraceae bacterium]HLS82048.1 HPF/RaiA family ribosome-associated protein [Steroidobacter sp.]